MRPLSDSVPKPLLEVRGRALIEHHLEALARAGIGSIVINLWWLGEAIRARLGDGTRYGVSIRYSGEEPRALETAGGIFRALPLIGESPFAVVNGDIYTDYPFGDLAIGADRDAHLVLVPNRPHHPAGDFGLDQDGNASPEATPRHTFAGIAVYRRAFVEGCADGVFPLKPLLLRAMARGRCSAEVYRGAWEDVGTPARLEALNKG
jgi:MurNAc alpha-1-phosphate uridylyltransferase